MFETDPFAFGDMFWRRGTDVEEGNDKGNLLLVKRFHQDGRGGRAKVFKVCR